MSLAALVLALVGFGGASGCADPCTDDGLGQKSCPTGQEAGGTATEGAGTEAEGGSGTAESDSQETGDGTMGTGDGDGDASGDGDGDGDGDPTGDGDGDASGDGDGDPPPSCNNGMQDGDETDVDCGGSCLDTCLDGDACLLDDDCINHACNTNVCKDPVCDPADNNGCQGCLQQQCCDAMIDCFGDPDCLCWFECISHNNDFQPCQDMCNVGNIGTITSCANSKCNTAEACAVP